MFKLIQEAGYFFRSHFLNLMLLMLAINVPVDLFLNKLSHTISQENWWVLWLISSLTKPLAGGAVLLYIHATIQNSKPKLSSCYFAAIPLYMNLVTADMVSSLLIITGLSLYIIPGIYIFYRLLFVPIGVVIHRQSVLQALKQSLLQTRQNILFILPAPLLLFILTLLTQQTLLDLTPGNNLEQWPNIIAGQCLVSALSVLFIVLVYRIYQSLYPEYLK